ncbi:MAG: Undecaprenyl-phosphate galactose phosphotransferase [Gammaproteobacteria bacterium]|jgi:lipopolysaccharide/colanic/teichoic acid biosynthesis glycosyltransferase|nr:Undecaprenyl-phosphate galactose phosphotransferase [Gammaproteobacteria bacterium]
MQFIIKRIFDFCIASLLFIALLPFLLLIGFGVWLEDRGPIFYCQQRFGKNAKPFEIYKFRSMQMGSDSLRDELPGNPSDPRLTQFGRFIRAWSLDELPQLWNVIKGNMSLVGPRPRNTDDPPLSQYNEIQKIRFKVKPGITGLAQIKGRNRISWEEIAGWDAQYVKNFSLWLDLKILLVTFAKVLKRDGVYRS